MLYIAVIFSCQLLKSKHGESLHRAANDRLHEKIQQVMREKEELERKCEKLIYNQHQLNTKLVEAKSKIQKITLSSGINNDQLRNEGGQEKRL
jgi:hypothetical protein